MDRIFLLQRKKRINPLNVPAKCPDKLIPGNNEETIPRDKATFINLFISLFIIFFLIVLFNLYLVVVLLSRCPYLNF